MYAGYGFRSGDIGDVEVVIHEGRFHLFHLVLPNHAYIAHAVSEDGLHWKRVENALFISEPGTWDDDMLWTMSVSPDPVRPGTWRMFYTGLTLGEDGRIQRIGAARSTDLIHWEKDTSDAYPVSLETSPYEHSLDQGRHWVSFRDPYHVQDGDRSYLLAAARVDHGPLIRRGCVALFEEVSPDRFEPRPPLFHPGRYDDVEVPVLRRIEGRWYLLGSIREDVKVHYWFAETFAGPYRNFADNVLLPQGNYAGRISYDGERWLVWNFFFKGLVSDRQHQLPPPKELMVAADGALALRSYSGFDRRVVDSLEGSALLPPTPLFGLAEATSKAVGDGAHFGCDSGFEVFALPGVYGDLRLGGEFSTEGDGKLGLAFRLSEDGEGYYLSIEVRKGVVQLRAWSSRPDGGAFQDFTYVPLQANYYVPRPGGHSFLLLVYGTYLEFSLDEHVLLTLADDHFSEGRVGFYVESAKLSVSRLRLDVLQRPPSGLYDA